VLWLLLRLDPSLAKADLNVLLYVVLATTLKVKSILKLFKNYKYNKNFIILFCF